MKFTPELPLDKQSRGFGCLSSGALLCPVTYDYNNRQYVLAAVVAD